MSAHWITIYNVRQNPLILHAVIRRRDKVTQGHYIPQVDCDLVGTWRHHEAYFCINHTAILKHSADELNSLLYVSTHAPCIIASGISGYRHTANTKDCYKSHNRTYACNISLGCFGRYAASQGRDLCQPNRQSKVTVVVVQQGGNSMSEIQRYGTCIQGSLIKTQ